MNSVLHNFSLRSDSVGRLAAVMASVYDLSWKMICIARLWMYSICLVCFFVIIEIIIYSCICFCMYIDSFSLSCLVHFVLMKFKPYTYTFNFITYILVHLNRVVLWI